MQQQQNPLVDFYNQLPPELQEKIKLLPFEKQQEVLTQLMQKYQEQSRNQQFTEGGEVDSQQIMQMVTQTLQQGIQPEEVIQMLVEQGIPQEQAMQVIQKVMQSVQNQSEQEQQFTDGGQAQNIPVEAERNENITIQDGQQPQVDGGYLEQQSYNPVTGQSTYEIPDDEFNQTHENGGVNMELTEGDVINSDKTKIPIDFKVYGKNFKNKTFKDASDYLSKQETKIQDDFSKKVKEGKTDKVSEISLQIMLAKLGKNRDELNELQEQVLESKKQEEYNKSLKSGLAEYGKVVLEMNKAEHGFNTSLDRYLNYKVTDRPVLKAAEGLNASIEKFSKFADKVTSDSNMSIKDIMSAYKQSGLGNVTSFNNSSFKTPVSFDYKPKNVTVPKQEIFSTINSVANKYGVDPALMFTMADIESTFNPNATSKTGAAGLFQFTKGTGKQYGISGEKRYDLQANTDAGARLLLDNQKILIKNGIEPTPVYIYLAHQLGAEGAIELYNNITKGTPISNTTKSNMGLNFGKKSAEQYLAETTKKVMSRYDGYVIKLQQKDADLSLNAHQLKQQYQLPYQLKEIKSDLYNFGVKGIIERLKANTYKPTVSNTQQQSSQFNYGGKIYADEGLTLVPNNIKKYQKENEEGNSEFWKNIYDYYSSEQSPLTTKFNYKKDQELTPQLQKAFQTFLFDNLGEDFIRQYLSTQEPSNIAKKYKINNSDLFLDKEKVPTDVLKNVYVDGLRGWRVPIVKLVNEISLPHGQNFSSNNINYTTYPNQSINKYNTPTGQIYYFNPGNERLKFNTDEEYNEYIKDKQNPQLLNNRYYYYDKDKNKFINPYIKDKNVITEKDPNLGALVRAKGVVVGGGRTAIPDRGVPTTQENKTSWMDKLKYGLRESLPYLRNIALMREKQFEPILQQKPYDNPYDNMRTDYNIQSNLNENQRALLTQMGDTRGNPSVRNARMAQIIANMQNNNNQLYTQKYNQELELENQKVMGQSQYRGQLDDINRGLKKQFEHEVLQTREVARQQKNMAIDNMMNDYLRKQEQNQAIDLSLLETNYDWNPYTGKYEFNKEKAERNFAEKKYLAKNSSSSDNSKIIEGADGESYEIITPKSGKPIIRKIEKKYGGKVVKY